MKNKSTKKKEHRPDEEVIQILNLVMARGEADLQLLAKLGKEYGFSKKDFETWRKQYGNKFTANTRSRRLDASESYLSVDSLASELGLPLESILHFASQGLIPIFTFSRRRDATFLFVHRDFIAPLGLKLPESVMSLPNRSSIGISPLCSQDITGFFLNAQDCSELLKEGRVRQGLFPAALRQRFDLYSKEFAIPGYFPGDRYPDIDPMGWGVACYPKDNILVLDPEKGYPLPIILDIKLTALYVIREDIEAFLNIIDTQAFLDDLLIPPPENPSSDDWTIFHVIVDKPSYISAKLTHLIETSERFWRRKTSDDPKDYSVQRDKVHEALNDPDFLSKFKMTKAKVSPELHETAARFIEPLYARNISNEGKRSGHAYLSPELLILLAAAKLFWSPSHVNFDDPATHPRNEEIENYLGIRGIKGNDADYAMTLIRPEQATYGGRKSSIRLWDRHNPLLRAPDFPPLHNDS